MMDCKVVVPKLNELQLKHSALFSVKLGKVKGLKAKLNIKENAVQKFTKARPIPFALRELVVEETERLEGVSFSHWTSPIVIATRPDGRIRMCGDFKSTINPILENEEYRII